MKKTFMIAVTLFVTFFTTVLAQGTLKWGHSIGTVSSDLRGCPAIADDGTIYIGSKNEKISALNPDGTFKWEFETLGTSWGSPAIDSDGTIYIGSNISNTNYSAGLRKNFFAINPDGTLKWSAEIGIAVDNSPAIGPDGTIYIPSSIGLSAFNPDGTLKWNYSELGNSYSTPAISSNGTIFIAGWDRLYALNENGTLKWSIAMQEDVRSSPAIGADGTIYIGAKDNYLYALNPTDGSEKWKFNAGSFVLTAPIIDAEGVIYFGSYKGKFYALYPDGTEKWHNQFSEDLGFLENSGAALGNNNVIYFGTSDPTLFYIRKVYALNLDGSIKWEYQSDLVIDSPPGLASDGTVYIGTTEGTLLAINGESTGTATTPWPKYRGCNKNTGLGTDSPASGVFSVNSQSIEAKCYPNPFETITTIDFSLNKQDFVSVKIYNLLGVEIETLYNGIKGVGNHSVRFNAEESGIKKQNQFFLCKIQVGSQIKTSFVLLKY